MLKNLYKSGKLKAWAMMKDKLRAEHKLGYLFWECTLRCNFLCKHCGSSAGGGTFEGELTTAEIKDTWKSSKARTQKNSTLDSPLPAL